MRLEKRFKEFLSLRGRKITERHRHRYEFNNDYKERFENAGMVVSGTNPDSGLCEILKISIIRGLSVFSSIRN